MPTEKLVCVASDLEILAASKLFGPTEVQKARAGVGPGKGQMVDLVLWAQLGLNVGEDHDAPVTGKIPTKTFVTWLLSKHAPQVVAKTVREFKEFLDGGGDEGSPELAPVKAEADEAWKEIAESTRQPKKGTVTVASRNIRFIRPEIAEKVRVSEANASI